MTWNHRMCGDCWIEREINSEIARLHRVIRCPVVVIQTAPGVCCFCKQFTRIGLFIRHNPAEMSCEHPEEE